MKLLVRVSGSAHDMTLYNNYLTIFKVIFRSEEIFILSFEKKETLGIKYQGTD
jgi:hypothetical protein